MARTPYLTNKCSNVPFCLAERITIMTNFLPVGYVSGEYQRVICRYCACNEYDLEELELTELWAAIFSWEEAASTEVCDHCSQTFSQAEGYGD
jgi:hypothetical protein